MTAPARISQADMERATKAVKVVAISFIVRKGNIDE